MAEVFDLSSCTYALRLREISRASRQYSPDLSQISAITVKKQKVL